MVRYTVFMCAPKLRNSQRNLPHRTKQKKSNEEIKSQKNWDAQKKWSRHKGRRVSPEAGRESLAGKICERGRSWAGSERERELWMVRVVSWESKKMWQEHEQASQETEGLEWGWRRELGSWFQRHGEAYREEQANSYVTLISKQTRWWVYYCCSVTKRSSVVVSRCCCYCLLWYSY